MGFPTPPDPSLTPIPRWCYSPSDPVSVRTDPTDAIRQQGWQLEPGQQYGKIPPLQWQNFNMWSVGEWINYFNAFAVYIQSGYIRTQLFCYYKSSSTLFTNTDPFREGYQTLNYDTVYLDRTQPENIGLYNSSSATFTAPSSGGNFTFNMSLYFTTPTALGAYSIIMRSVLYGVWYTVASGNITDLSQTLFLNGTITFTMTGSEQIQTAVVMPPSSTVYCGPTVSDGTSTRPESHLTVSWDSY